jgi:hypothetical protein
MTDLTATAPATTASMETPAMYGTAGMPSTAIPGAAPIMPRYYMTSDLRVATGLTRTHLDFYLREGIILPTARTESGYLLFDENELRTLRTIVAWRQEGIGIREIRSRLGR